MVRNLDEGCGLLKVLHVAPQLFLQRCSEGPLLRSCFSEKSGPSCRTVFGDCGPARLGLIKFVMPVIEKEKEKQI